MIKGIVTVTGKIAKEGSVYTSPKGEHFYETLLIVHLLNKEGEPTPLWIKVKCPQTKTERSTFVKGNYLFAEGTLSVSAYKGKLYFTLWADKVIPQTAHTESIQGEVTVKGFVGKKIYHNAGIKDKEFIVFSVASSDGNNDERVTTWVNCTMQPNTSSLDFHKGYNVMVTGGLSMKYYKDRLDIQCKVKAIESVSKYSPSSSPVNQ